MTKVLQLFSWAFLLLNYVAGAAIQESKQVYEPNPPVTHRVLFGIEYTDPETETVKQLEVVAELYGTVAPKTVENFFALSRGVKGALKKGEKDEVFDITYKNTIFHRIIPNFVIQGGNVLPDIAPFSIYGMSFADEPFHLKHDRPGRVSMANSGPDSNASQFFFTVSEDPLESLDNHHVVFGQVIGGLEELMDAVQHVEIDKETNKPVNNVTIVYSYAEGLRIANLDELHEAYTEQVNKFRNGDKSVGITLKQELAEGAKDEANLENKFYYHEHPATKYIFAFILIGGLLTIYANRKSLIPRARNVVSVRS